MARKCPKFEVLSEILIFSIDVDPDVADLHNLGTLKKKFRIQICCRIGNALIPLGNPKKMVGYAKIEKVPYIKQILELVNPVCVIFLEVPHF